MRLCRGTDREKIGRLQGRAADEATVDIGLGKNCQRIVGLLSLIHI